MTRKTSFSSPSPRPPRSLIFRDFCLLREWKSCPKWIVLRECPFFRLRGFLLLSRFFFSFPTTIVPCLTRQRPRLLFLSILFAWRMYPIIYNSTVDVFFSMKIKKCVLIIYKSSVDVFFFGENKKMCVEGWEEKISIVFELLCIIDYIRYLIIIAFIRIRIFYIFEFGFAIAFQFCFDFPLFSYAPRDATQRARRSMTKSSERFTSI